LLLGNPRKLLNVFFESPDYRLLDPNVNIWRPRFAQTFNRSKFTVAEDFPFRLKTPITKVAIMITKIKMIAIPRGELGTATFPIVVEFVNWFMIGVFGF